MSWHVISDVYKAKLGSPARKAIAAKLADWADDDGGSIYPSIQRVADETETSVRTVQYVLREFVAEGLLVIVAAGGRGPGSTTEYRMCLKHLAALPRTRTSRKPKGATVAPLAKAKRVQLTADKGAPAAPDSSRTVRKNGNAFFEKKKAQPTGTLRDTSESFEAYTARMQREGKFKPRAA